MTNDPRSALNRLIAALEAHFDAATSGDENSPAVIAAEDALEDAFFTYDDALFTSFGIELPFDTVDDEGYSEDDDLDEDEDTDDDPDDDALGDDYEEDFEDEDTDDDLDNDR